MLTLRNITQRRVAAPDSGPSPTGVYRDVPGALGFHLILWGVVVLAAGIACLALRWAGSLASGGALAVMVIPAGLILLGSGIALWIRRPRIEREVQRAIADWPALVAALRRESGPRSRPAQLLAELGYRTSTARRAILALWSEVRPARSSLRRTRRRHHAGAGAIAPPTREQLAPQLVPPRASIWCGIVLTVLATAALWLGRHGLELRGLAFVLLVAICGVCLLAGGIADLRSQAAVRAEVERALHEWPDLVRDLRAETARGTLPTAALQARGYRSYPVRRAILRCFYRELAG
ncbi:MAG: hypothetical protein KDE27_04100 [Planctomycetes bacterium]|nr:hypothetical protein [Planctomycetota bacterium]